MRELNMETQTPCAFPALRTPRHLLREYIGLQVLHTMTVENVGWMLTLVHSIMSHFILFCNYTILANWDTLDAKTIVSGVDKVYFLKCKKIGGPTVISVINISHPVC